MLDFSNLNLANLVNKSKGKKLNYFSLFDQVLRNRRIFVENQKAIAIFGFTAVQLMPQVCHTKNPGTRSHSNNFTFILKTRKPKIPRKCGKK